MNELLAAAAAAGKEERTAALAMAAGIQKTAAEIAVPKKEPSEMQPATRTAYQKNAANQNAQLATVNSEEWELAADHRTAAGMVERTAPDRPSLAAVPDPDPTAPDPPSDATDSVAAEPSSEDAAPPALPAPADPAATAPPTYVTNTKT